MEEPETPAYRRIVALLRSEGVAHEEFAHGHVHSSEDAASVRGTRIEEAAKALVLETGSGRLVQCIVAGHRRADLRKLKALLGERNVSLAHPAKVLAATGCPIGSVPPFGNLCEPPIPVYADAELLTRDHVVFSAGSHYRSVRMRAQDWARLSGATVADIGKER